MKEKPSERRSEPSDVAAIAREHDVLRELYLPIENAVARRQDGRADAPTDAALSLRLQAFRDRLAEHFRFEEESGLLAAIMLMNPRPGESVQEWLGVHRSLLMCLNGLIRSLEHPRPNVRRSGFPAQELREFREQLRGHDDFENSLLGRVRSFEFRTWQRSFETR